MDLWTQFLNFLAQIITPVWNDLLQYMPLLFTGAIGLLVVREAWVWNANAALNRPRVPRPLTAGPPPAGVHLPGSSIWPFFLPIGGALILLGLALAPAGAVVNPVLLVLGLGVAGLAALGWYRDAGREWQAVEAGRPLGQLAATTTAVATRETPPGIHLPDPSPWPFFAPIALVFVFGGLVFGPALLVGGLVMGFIAALGWYLDAGHEYRQVEAGHLAEPRTRDPERAFPKRLVPVYMGIAGLVIFITLAPWLMSYLPGNAGAPSASGSAAGGGGAPSSAVEISATTATSFSTNQLVVAAGKPFTLTFDNKQAGVPHNVAIYDSSAKATTLFTGDVITGPAQAVYNVPALPAGSYYFQCNVHPATMNGTLIVK